MSTKTKTRRTTSEPVKVPMHPELAATIEYAERVLGFPLRERGRDSLDFHEVGVLRLRRLLVEAFDAGTRAASR